MHEESQVTIMGKFITSKRPPLCQSKLLCLSLLYLFTSLFLALYTSLSETKCLFRSSPFDPIQAPLFFYPHSYGEHKYAIPTLRSSCSSPVYFSDYWDALKEIQDEIANTTLFPRRLRYMHGDADSFGGNFSFHKRISYFDHWNDNVEVPCGFFKPFPITDSDKSSMENCNGAVVVSAIFNDHDKIRQPKGLGSKTLENVCFIMFVDDVTLKGLQQHNIVSGEASAYMVGAWRIVKVVANEGLYDSPAMNGVIPKYLVHRLFPNAKFSIWVDAKMQLVVDPLLLIHALLVSENVDMAISKHPFYQHTMEEAMATARWKKWWDIDSLKTQMETYCENGLQPWTPNKTYPSDVPDSAIILRRHAVGSNLFSCLLFNELEAFNPRDQLAFAYVRDLMKPKLKLNMFEVEVFEHVAVEYRHNIKKVGAKIIKTKRASPDLYVNGSSGKCHKYLLEMWEETHN